jgi:hypothetical protein
MVGLRLPGKCPNPMIFADPSLTILVKERPSTFFLNSLKSQPGLYTTLWRLFLVS